MKTLKNILTLLVTAFILTNCEKEVTVDLPDPVEKIVVEGSIESGSPPFVTLNKNFPYFGTFTPADFAGNFVRNATVMVSDGSTSAQLDEICWSELTEEQKEFIAQFAGGALPDSIPDGFDFCVYTFFSLNPPIVGQPGKTYTLQITTAEGKELSAVTTIPQPVPLDSIWYEQNTDPDYPNLYRIYARITDPDTLGNYYRYYTQRQTEPMYPGFRSVYDDLLINGLNVFFPLDRGIFKGADIDFQTYGYFEANDTVTVKWSTIDTHTYNFWRTLEFSTNSGSPLGGSTQINHNINGGIGVWAGYCVSTLQTIVINP
ncbi:DUF4249 domain-containing protein [Sphingobacteriales bacterium UPWRP_1]|nr:hypothetical protein BVG80_07220 [Sphingobacteriales bacterium TSM_CSM]PSJ78221.1 DUF4249 domain-containing protein [Sphingobacteriales bacterium UPWRP_1]